MLCDEAMVAVAILASSACSLSLQGEGWVVLMSVNYSLLFGYCQKGACSVSPCM